jgi:hypothetical protein
MSRTTPTVSILFFFAVSASHAAEPPAPEATKKIATLQVQLFRVSGDISGTTSLTDNIWEGVETSSRFNLFTLADLNVAGVKLKADASEWLWNGGKVAPPSGSVQTIGQPTITAVMGEPFTIEVSSDTPIEYLEKRADGLFELKRLDEKAGFSISATFEPGESSRIVIKDFKISLRSIARRVPIEGVTLDVGRPVVETWEQRTTLAVKPGMDYGMQIASQGYGSLILRFKATEIKPGETPPR